MITNSEPITLETLGGGAAAEKFEIELQRVLDNIVDPNTKAEAPREVTLKVKITPDEKRSMASITITTSSKLAQDAEFASVCALGSVNGKGVAREFKQNMPLFGAEEGDNVVGIDQHPRKED